MFKVDGKRFELLRGSVRFNENSKTIWRDTVVQVFSFSNSAKNRRNYTVGPDISFENFGKC